MLRRGLTRSILIAVALVLLLGAPAAPNVAAEGWWRCRSRCKVRLKACKKRCKRSGARWKVRRRCYKRCTVRYKRCKKHC